MWIALIAVSFCLGLLAGYQLPVWLSAWRSWRHRKTFRLTVLKQYHPATGQEAGKRIDHFL